MLSKSLKMNHSSVLLSDVEGEPLGQIAEFLGHHDAVALAGVCKRLRTTLLGDGNNSGLCWKAIVLETLHQKNKHKEEGEKTVTFQGVSLNGKNGTIGWYGVSQLIHSNLRKRKILACLELATHYHHESPRNGWGPVDVNRNENICLLMGNHATENFRKWLHLPFREHVPPSIQLHSPPLQRTVIFEKRGRNITHSEPVRWIEFELQLLAEAGKRGIGSVGKLVKKAVNTIVNELPLLPPVASSGSLKGLDPKLCVRGLDNCPLTLPLSHQLLDKVVQSDCCKQSSFGQSGIACSNRRVDESIRKCWTIDLHSDVQVTDPTFQQYLQASYLATSFNNERSGDDAPGLWSAVRERFLPRLHGLRDRKHDTESTYSVVARPSKMLIYEKGGKFKPHRDAQHGPGHFGTLVILLPVSTASSSSDDIGGDLVLRCERQATKANHSEAENSCMLENHKPPTNGASATWHIFMLGTCHEVRPVKCEYRVALTYQLWFDGGGPILRAPRLDLISLLGRSIQYWVESNNMEELVEFVLPLQHCYPLRGDRKDEESGEEWFHPLSESKLQGQDSWLFRGLTDALNGTEMELDLEYNGVDIGIVGYSQGVVVGRGAGLKTVLPEEQSKIIWLHHDEGRQLVDSSRDGRDEKTLVVACISFHHKKFRSRYGRCYGFSGSLEGWTHPDDKVRCD
jgi:hypothetical protein